MSEPAQLEQQPETSLVVSEALHTVELLHRAHDIIDSANMSVIIKYAGDHPRVRQLIERRLLPIGEIDSPCADAKNRLVQNWLSVKMSTTDIRFPKFLYLLHRYQRDYNITNIVKYALSRDEDTQQVMLDYVKFTLQGKVWAHKTDDFIWLTKNYRGIFELIAEVREMSPQRTVIAYHADLIEAGRFDYLLE